MGEAFVGFPVRMEVAVSIAETWGGSQYHAADWRLDYSGFDVYIITMQHVPLLPHAPNAMIPDGLSLDGWLYGVNAFVGKRFDHRIILHGPQQQSAVDMATGEMVLTMTMMVGLIAPEFDNGGGI